MHVHTYKFLEKKIVFLAAGGRPPPLADASAKNASFFLVAH